MWKKRLSMMVAALTLLLAGGGALAQVKVSADVYMSCFGDYCPPGFTREVFNSAGFGFPVSYGPLSTRASSVPDPDGQGPTVCLGICVFTDARAYADEASGILRTYAVGSLVNRKFDSTYSLANELSNNALARARLSDTFMLSQDATVVLRGSVDGKLTTSASSGTGAVNTALASFGLKLSVAAAAAIPVDGESVPISFGHYVLNRHEYGSFNDAITLVMHLPGNVPLSFDVDMNSAVQLHSTGNGIGGQSEGTSDYFHTLSFGFEVPAGVTLTSASGALPLVPVPEPAGWALMLAGLTLLGLRRTK